MKQEVQEVQEVQDTPLCEPHHNKGTPQTRARRPACWPQTTSCTPPDEPETQPLDRIGSRSSCAPRPVPRILGAQRVPGIRAQARSARGDRRQEIVGLRSLKSLPVD